VGILDIAFGGIALLQMILAVPAMAVLALHQRIMEDVHVSGRFPHPARQNHRGVQADDVIARMHHRTPPLTLDVLLQLYAERTVIPGRACTAVDVTAREYEPSALAQADNGVHGRRRHASPSGWVSAGNGDSSRIRRMRLAPF